jgi:hypothetical protein
MRPIARRYLPAALQDVLQQPLECVELYTDMDRNTRWAVDRISVLLYLDGHVSVSTFEFVCLRFPELVTLGERCGLAYLCCRVLMLFDCMPTIYHFHPSLPVAREYHLPDLLPADSMLPPGQLFCYSG